MKDKILKTHVLVCLLLLSVFGNFFLGYQVYGYQRAMDIYDEYYDVSWEAVTKTMDVWNQTQNYIDEQRQAIDDLTMLNIAWSMYDITGNTSWFPQSPGEFNNVTNIK